MATAHGWEVDIKEIRFNIFKGRLLVCVSTFAKRRSLDSYVKRGGQAEKVT